MLVGGVVVEDDVDHLAGRHLGLDRVQEADELLMAVALHVAADDGPVEDVERSEQGRGAMALVVVRHGAEPALHHASTGKAAHLAIDLGQAGTGLRHRLSSLGSRRPNTIPRWLWHTH